MTQTTSIVISIIAIFLFMAGFTWCFLLYLAVIKTDEGEYYPRAYKFYSRIFRWGK